MQFDPFSAVERGPTYIRAPDLLQKYWSMSRTERPGSAGRKLWGQADSRMTRRAISSTCSTVSTRSSPLPADHGTGSRSQILIEARSMVPRNV